MIIIYGDEPSSIAKLAKELRETDKTVEIHLKSAKRFKNAEACKTVYVLGDHPGIVEAYEGKAKVIVPAAAEADDAEVKPSQKAKKGK